MKPPPKNAVQYDSKLANVLGLLNFDCCDTWANKKTNPEADEKTNSHHIAMAKIVRYFN